MIKNSKKLLLSSLAATALFATTSNAGVLVDFEVGAGSWNANPSGSMHLGQTVDIEKDLGFSDSNNAYVYADFNHFVPLVPNIRIEQQELSTNAAAVGAFSWNGNSITQGKQTDIDLKQQDLLLYWGVPGLNLLSAGIIDVNFGIDIKKFDGSVTIDNDKSKLDFIVPMGYIGATIDPPFIPAQLSASYKTIRYDGSSLNDLMAKVSIELPIPIPLIDIKFDVGYKEQSLDISSSLSDNISADIKFSGMFFGVSAKF